MSIIQANTTDYAASITFEQALGVAAQVVDGSGELIKVKLALSNSLEDVLLAMPREKQDDFYAASLVAQESIRLLWAGNLISCMLDGSRA
jgi:cytochrome c biogenesis factor